MKLLSEMKELFNRNDQGISNEGNNVNAAMTDMDNIALCLSYDGITAFHMATLTEVYLNMTGEIKERKQISQGQFVYLWYCPFGSNDAIATLQNVLNVILQN